MDKEVLMVGSFGFYSADYFLNSEFPLTASEAADVGDVFHGTRSVRFVDALDLETSGHMSGPFMFWGRLDDMGESGVIVLLVTDQSLPSAPS